MLNRRANRGIFMPAKIILATSFVFLASSSYAHNVHDNSHQIPSEVPMPGVVTEGSQTVLFEITKNRPSGKDWNSKENTIKVRRGDVIHIVDLEGGHWFHSFGQPCPHGTQAIGTGFDCVINANAPLGPVQGYVGEHNILQYGIAWFYIEIVE